MIIWNMLLLSATHFIMMSMIAIALQPVSIGSSLVFAHENVQLSFSLAQNWKSESLCIPERQFCWWSILSSSNVVCLHTYIISSYMLLDFEKRYRKQVAETPFKFIAHIWELSNSSETKSHRKLRLKSGDIIYLNSEGNARYLTRS